MALELSIDTITFGKYVNKSLEDVLKDRSYCKWLLQQDWFQTSYEYLYNRVNEYDPKIYFLNPIEIEGDFICSYTYFNLTPVDEVQLELNEKERICYIYYLRMISELKEKIKDGIKNGNSNPFDIKAPVNWLKRFEKETGLTRDDFKFFINSYELPNIPYIVKDIKKEGGIEYLGADSFNIAKKRSLEQEAYWEEILKSKYGEDICFQFKYENCIFDMLLISSNTIFECKLNLENFNEEQHRKYKLILDKYRIVYLIGKDCVVNIEDKAIYTNDEMKYSIYQSRIPTMKKASKFDKLIKDFSIQCVEDLTTLF